MSDAKSSHLPGRASTWPHWAQHVAELRDGPDAGVGDTVKRLLGTPGTAIERTLAAFGICCGCCDRRQRWNQRFPYEKHDE